jgi:hypothetical protein
MLRFDTHRLRVAAIDKSVTENRVTEPAAHANRVLRATM